MTIRNGKYQIPASVSDTAQPHNTCGCLTLNVDMFGHSCGLESGRWQRVVSVPAGRVAFDGTWWVGIITDPDTGTCKTLNGRWQTEADAKLHVRRVALGLCLPATLRTTR